MIFLLVAVLAQSAPAPAPAPQSPTLSSAVRARALLRDALAAMGGLPAIESLAVVREYTGTRTDAGQNVREPRPGEPPQINGRPRFMRFRNYRTGDLVDITADTIPGGQPFSLRYVARGDSGFSFMYDAATLRRTPPPPPAVWRAFFQNEDVEGLLLSAWRQQGTARAIGPSVIVFTDVAQVATTIYFDSSTHLPLKSETLSDDAVRGDVVTEMWYRDWRAVSGLTLPYAIETRLNGAPLQRLQLSAVRFGAVPDSLFRIPSDAVESSTPPAAPIALGSDVYVVPSRYQSAFVVFDDYVLVLEPGGSPGNARFTIASVKQVAPTKPIRYVVATHAHFDHLAGVREYIALGATFVTTPAAARVIQRASTAVHLMQPDSLSKHPQGPRIETMTEDVRVFRDATHEVRVYQLGPTTHVDAMLFAYVPATKTLFVADALDIPEPGHVRMGGEDTQRLADRIAELKLDVERIVPVHGRMGTLADLNAALAKRARQ